MRRSLIGAVSAAALIAGGTLLPSGATAGAGNSNAPQDFVVGGGENNPAPPFPINHFAINAHSGPNGENPFGEVHFVGTTNGPPVRRFNGPVVCLRVSGNVASIVMRFRNTKDQPPQFVGDLLFVQDNGEPVNGQPVDQVRNIRLTSIPQSCPPPMPPGTAPITSGNIQVHDAS
jgi:hypothetical protein